MSQDRAEMCNQMDEVWVPSPFSREALIRSGVKSDKIQVIPPFLDLKRFLEMAVPLELPQKRGFNFLSLYEFSLRKGWETLVQAYVEEFDRTEDVCLYLKTGYRSRMEPGRIEQRLIAFIRETLGRDLEEIPDVVLLTQDIEGRFLPCLYRATDAFVLPSHGEGWARGIGEAMACGLPVITTGYGNPTAFLNRKNAFLLDYTLATVSQEAAAEEPDLTGQTWAVPSTAHLRRVMREVFAHREEAGLKGQAGREAVTDCLSWNKVSEQIRERIYGETLCPQP
jgi:glycosyltransferase involved in cell wall biosynthesis